MADSKHRLNLARKYRPQSLEQVQGQSVAVKILSEALKTDQIAPAYLFSGPRGVGKTTSARIFARAASCLSAEHANRPCGKCASCTAYLTGKFMDLIEIDGASHTGVDDVRTIVEKIAYRPAIGKRSVYIIDEVHMLSNAAFNALLKTLEEPPPFALFLFATTEPEKIPSTILSRVQRIELQRLKDAQIVNNLKEICAKEGFSVEEKILEQIATSSDGSLRDAQTFLEQLILLSGGPSIPIEIVDVFLGTIGIEQELEILGLVAKSVENPSGKYLTDLLSKIAAFFQQGKDLVRLLSRLLGWARALLLTKAAPQFDALKEEYNPDHLKKLEAAFSKWSVEDCDRLFEILWSGYERIRRSEVPRITFETTLIRATRIPLTEDLARLVQALEGGAIISSPPPLPSPRPTSPSRASIPAASDRVQPETTLVPTNTDELLQEIKNKRPTIYAIVACAEMKNWEGTSLFLKFPKGHFAFRQLSEKILHTELSELVQRLTQGTCKNLVVEEAVLSETRKNEINRSPNFMKEAQKAALEDSAVQKAAELLGAKIESVTVSGVKTKAKTP